ncbi:ubiquitin domain-containing protein 1 isoform X5 [Cherax quadricarinatus]|uniref:ubiquitin domain-containing protein 1 isoform X5 n=1 Tax=Cherax quadricarinatus TaxID=27406 RepID=UPI00387E5139
MGGCVGTAREGSTSSRTSSAEGSTSVRVFDGRDTMLLRFGGTSIGKNVPLRHERIRWKSDMPLTEGQVRSKRDEFWDTAPAFEGRREIWDALKAAALAIENKDYDLAQAIIDGANITLPNGALTDCYDELGTRYQLPVYCLSYPLNILQRSPDKDGENEAEYQYTSRKDNLRNACVLHQKLPQPSKTHRQVRKQCHRILESSLICTFNNLNQNNSFYSIAEPLARKLHYIT